MLDLDDRKLCRLRQPLQRLLYFGDSSTSEEKYNEQREEDAPRMHGVNDCCQRCDNDAEGCQGLSGISPVNKGHSGWDGDVGTARFGVRFSSGAIYGMPNSRNESCKYRDNTDCNDIAGEKGLTAWDP